VISCQWVESLLIRLPLTFPAAEFNLPSASKVISSLTLLDRPATNYHLSR